MICFLLLELCAAASLQIANTFQEGPPEQKVTYRELATKPMDAVTHTAFAELDLVLVEQKWSAKTM